MGAMMFKTSLNSLVSPSLLRNLAGVMDNGLACMSTFASMHLCLEFQLQLLSQTSFSRDSHLCFSQGLPHSFPLAGIHFVNVSKDFSVGKALSHGQEETHRHSVFMAVP